MRLLLTSAGITNDAIKKVFLDFVNKEPSDITIAFIPTAANVEDDKSWMQEDINNIKNMGVTNIHMVDISKMDKSEWLPVLEESDVIWLNGGNTYYLLDWVKKSGLNKELPQLLESRLYVGSSAGSMIVGPDLAINKLFPEEKSYRLSDITGLGYVQFTVLPHLNSPHFAEPTEKNVKEFAGTVSYPIYALDDNSAIIVSNGEINIISKGKYKIFNS